MSVVAGFRVVNDLARKLDEGKPLMLSFDVPAAVARGGDQPQCVVMVKYFLEGASGLTWDFCLNGSRLFESSGSGSHLLLNMEAFDSALLLPGENQVQIHRKHGVGTIRIADIVVHFHTHLPS
jgi:hypothetical protein